MTLATAPPYRGVRIVGFARDGDAVRRLLELGLHTGAEVRVLSAGGRDPLLVEVRDARFAISRDLACHVQVDETAPVVPRRARRRRRRRGQGG
jgi:Fe2+ transport system protein FeoA